MHLMESCKPAELQNEQYKHSSWIVSVAEGFELMGFSLFFSKRQKMTFQLISSPDFSLSQIYC